MKKLLLILVVALIACDKDDPGPKYESLAGTWQYVSADQQVSVVFDLTDSGNGYAVSNSTVTIKGETFTQHEAGIFGENSKASIEQILFKCQGCVSGLTFSVRLGGVSQVDGFSKMKSGHVTYSSLNHNINLTEADNVVISRKN